MKPLLSRAEVKQHQAESDLVSFRWQRGFGIEQFGDADNDNREEHDDRLEVAPDTRGRLFSPAAQPGSEAPYEAAQDVGGDNAEE